MRATPRNGTERVRQRQLPKPAHPTTADPVTLSSPTPPQRLKTSTGMRCPAIEMNAFRIVCDSGQRTLWTQTFHAASAQGQRDTIAETKRVDSSQSMPSMGPNEQQNSPRINRSSLLFPTILFQAGPPRMSVFLRTVQGNTICTNFSSTRQFTRNNSIKTVDRRVAAGGIQVRDPRTQSLFTG